MRINQINQIFSDFANLKVLIIGDVMIDTYFSGSVDRISPEAPVPIVSVKSEEHRLGGAANVARNIRSMSAQPIICTVVGDDHRSQLFLELCKKEKIDSSGVVKSNDRITTVKTRIIGNNHQLLRVDSEDINPINEKQEKELLDVIKKLIDEKSPDVIIFEDYDKGVLSKNLIAKVTELAIKNKIPTAADPKKKNFLSYKNITLFKPNLKEMCEGLKMEISSSKDAKFGEAVNRLKKLLEPDILLVTLSEEGVYCKSHNDEFTLPAYLRNISDVSGAGDTVISVAALCLALKQDERMIAHLANLAGGLVCEKVGVVPIDKDLLFQEAVSSIKID